MGSVKTQLEKLYIWKLLFCMENLWALKQFMEWYHYFNGCLFNRVYVTDTLPFLTCFYTEICCVLGIIAVLFMALVNRKYWNNESFISWNWTFLTIIILLMIYGLTMTEFMYYNNTLYEWVNFYCSTRFATSPLLLMAKYLLLILCLITVTIHRNYFVSIQNNWEYSVIVLTLIFSMLLLISCADFVVAALVLELQSFSLFIFMSFRRYSNLSIEAAVKFFIYTAFSGGCFLFGASLLYATYGTMNFIELHQLMVMDCNSVAVLSAVLILASIFIKLTIAPFYFWVGDVYQGTFNYVASLISIVTKLPAWVLLMKLLNGPFYGLASMYWVPAIQLLAVLSIAVGSFYSLTEYNFRRFWALSSVTHMGFIFLSLSFNNFEGWAIAIFYIIIYSFSTAFIWAVVMHLYPEKKETIELKEFLITLFEFTSIKRANKPLSFLISMVIFSLGGIPIGLGFLPKLLIFYQLYLQQNLFILFIVFAFNLISMAYYLRLVRFLIFNTKEEEHKIAFAPMPRSVLYIIVLIFLINFVFFIFFGMDLYLIIKEIVSWQIHPSMT